MLNSGHARADSAASPGEVTIDERGTIRGLDEDDDDDDDDKHDKDDNNTDDDQHNNNSSNGNNSSGAEDACDPGQYGINNNDRSHERDHKPDDHDRDHDDDDDDGDDDEDDDDEDDKDDDDEDDEDNKLNNRHHRQQLQQRSAVHRTDEVSPAKRNLLSPMLGGGAGLIGVKLDLLTNLATNPSNGELLINNNAQKIIQGVEEEEEDVEIEDEAVKGGGEVIHGINDTVTSIDAIAFLRGGRTGDPESLDDGEEQRNASSSSYGIDQTGFVGGSTPPILQNGVAGRPSGTYGDDPSVPSTSRRPDSHFSGTTANTASNLTSSPTAPSTAHQSLYRGVADQFVSVLKSFPLIVQRERTS